MDCSGGDPARLELKTQDDRRTNGSEIEKIDTRFGARPALEID